MPHRRKLYGQWLVGSAVMVFDFDNFDPKQLCTVINRYGVTSFCAPPTVYRYLGQHRIMGQGDSVGDFDPSESMKNGKYIQYSHIFHTFAWGKISRRISLPHYAVLP